MIIAVFEPSLNPVRAECYFRLGHTNITRMKWISPRLPSADTKD
jgi:hypothetical protein